MGAPDEVYQLVEKFDRDKPDSETELRDWYVDPLFTALGWDLLAKQQVRKEPSVTVREEGLERSKRADYSFHIGATRHFFVETKMPHINLERNTVPAFQLRRYGWSGGTPVSVLTDFEEFCVYDCRIEPNRNDPASKARLLYSRYTDYIDKWEELEARFSREAVAHGALREWVEGERVRGILSVDQSFLRKMENWRELLAKDIALHNRDLSQRQLNLLVQRTIDRIVFLRIAEDRDIESYRRLRSAASEGKQVYEELKQLFQEADDKYNSGLFHFGVDERASDPDRHSLKIHIPDEPLRHIITNLYFPFSPYEFSVLSADILGQVYEQFLGKVIELSPGGAVRVEDKPEVRKAGGVYYTPAYIVDYIVENTVGALLKEKTPADAEKLRILDPACGSGSFLVGAYQYLLDWHLETYSREPDKHKNVLRRIVGGYVLTTAEKRRILRNNIYGVDLDQNAVEVSKLSLLLKMLENESDATGRQTLMFAAGGRILPDLSDNIKWGNSLIGSDFFRGPQATLFDDEEKMLKVKAFDWDSEAGFGAIMAAGGFDAVIGNPPYIRIQTMKETAPETVPYYKKNYISASKGNYDIYVVFVERGLQLLNERGLLGFILPHKFFNAKYGEPLRGHISSGQNLNSIVHFGHQQIFEGATTYTCLLFLNRKSNQRFSYVSVGDVDSWQNQNGTESGFIDSTKVGSKSWNFIVGKDAIVFEKLDQFQSKLEHITDRIFQGLKTGSDKFYIVEKLAENDETYSVYSRQDNETHHLEKDLLHILIKGGDSHKYLIDDTVRLILFPYSTDGKLLSQLEIRHHFPLTWEYIEKHEEFLRSRERRKMDGHGWYAYTRNQALDVISKAKIFTPDIADVPSYSLDKNGDMFFTGGTAGGYGIVPIAGIKSEYLMGLLNSKLLNWYLRHISTSFRGGWYSYESRYIKQLPIRRIDFANPADIAMHDKMVELVDEMLRLHKRLPGLTGEGRRINKALIETVDSEIDALVYKLYGLSDDEVAIVEGEAGN